MDNRFLENAYGIRKSAVEKIFLEGKIPMTTIYTPVIDQFLSEYPDSETIFMMPASLELWENRLKSREHEGAEFDRRFQFGLQDIQQYTDAYKQFYKHEFLVGGDNNSNFIEAIRSVYEGHISIEGNYSRGKER